MFVSELPVGGICTDIVPDGNTELTGFDAAVLEILDDSNYRTVSAAELLPEYTAVLSKLRKNCVDWLPIRKNDSVLELGSDYGQLTGALAAKAGHVCCFDLDLVRTYISTVRNKDHTNITYCAYSGLSGLEAQLGDRKFDYIVMAEAFSEAALYFPQSDDPQRDMLAWTRERLSDRGRVVLAADNKYGFKSFNGSRILGEEHGGASLTGVTSMPQHRYFSLCELKDYMSAAGFGRSKFFYPLPEYRFMQNLYSDDYAPHRGELASHCYTWEYDRENLLNEGAEKEAFYAMAEDGTFSEFTNSYLVVASVRPGPDSELDPIQYVRFNPGRRAIYDMCTSILSRDGQRLVRKTPRSWYGKQHAANICESYRRMTAAYGERGVGFDSCTMRGDGVEFEYLEGRNLSSVINDCLVAKDYGRVTAEYDRLLDILSEKAQYFVPTRDFRETFGAADPRLLSLRAPAVSNVDMIPQNIIVTEDGRWHVIDYEWTLPFSVPILFILWRGIMYQFQFTKGDAGFLYKRYGIDDGLQAIFKKMELTFEPAVYSAKRPDQYRAIGHKALVCQPVHISKSRGQGAADEVVYRLANDLPPSRGVEVELDFPAEMKTVRTVLCSQCCLVKVRSVTDERGRNVPYRTNGVRLGNGNFLFKTTDPQIIIDGRGMLGTRKIRLNMAMELPGPEMPNSTAK